MRMHRFKLWVEHKGIHFLAALSVIVLGVTVFLSYMPTNAPSPGDEVTQPLPWVADLCLAYLGAYIFHALVVAMPAKRRMHSRLLTLREPLSTIALNGLNLIRDLEHIGNCPPRRITGDHLIRVLLAVNDNRAVRKLIAERLRLTREAYSTIVPFAADLPLELQELLHLENQHRLHSRYLKYAGKGKIKYIHFPEYQKVEMETFRSGETKRMNLVLVYEDIASYYEITQSAFLLLDPYLPEPTSGRRDRS